MGMPQWVKQISMCLGWCARQRQTCQRCHFFAKQLGSIGPLTRQERTTLTLQEGPWPPNFVCQQEVWPPVASSKVRARATLDRRRDGCFLKHKTGESFMAGLKRREREEKKKQFRIQVWSLGIGISVLVLTLISVVFAIVKGG